ncbi:MAG: sigma-70 family RNA polymerase sigma factor [Leptospiraceae bacterium]|nr:sigma-70 family RNA polymerase sigma factor [Leptospiraceae bacterium]
MSPEEFNEMFLENTDRIYSLGMRLFRSHSEDAMDFTQEVYLQAFKNMNKFAGNSAFSTWLYSVALNLGLNQIRRRKIIKTQSSDAEFSEELVDSRDETPENQSIRQETIETIRSEIELLPENYRLPLMLFYYEEMSYQKISEKLNIKEGTLKSLVHRARNLLKDALKKRGIE